MRYTEAVLSSHQHCYSPLIPKYMNQIPARTSEPPPNQRGAGVASSRFLAPNPPQANLRPTNPSATNIQPSTISIIRSLMVKDHSDNRGAAGSPGLLLVVH